MMSTKDKMTIAADIVIAIMSNSTKDTYDRLEAVPNALEKIYNKIDELDKKTNDNNKDKFNNDSYPTQQVV